MRYAALALLLGVSACTQYWVRPATNNATASADLADCRKGAGNLTMMYELEVPCMQSRGYQLSNTPSQ